MRLIDFSRRIRARSFDTTSAVTLETATFFDESSLLSETNRYYNEGHILLQLSSGHSGSCFCPVREFDTTYLKGVVGELITQIPPINARWLEIAYVDALYGIANEVDGIVPQQSYSFDGLARQKSRNRAQLLIRTADIREGERVLLVGAVFDIARAAQDLGAIVSVADFGFVGHRIGDIEVHADALGHVAWADVILITGNALYTDTLHDIVSLARLNGKRTVVYAQTAPNIAARYIGHGVDGVLTEEFPYYWYSNMVSRINIYQG